MTTSTDKHDSWDDWFYARESNSAIDKARQEEFFTIKDLNGDSNCIIEIRAETAGGSEVNIFAGDCKRDIIMIQSLEI
jgi:protein subunit release factor A